MEAFRCMNTGGCCVREAEGRLLRLDSGMSGPNGSPRSTQRLPRPSRPSPAWGPTMRSSHWEGEFGEGGGGAWWGALLLT